MFDLDRWEEIWQTINRNRKRSIMTAFGVFWGIFMLTVMMGSGLGLRNLLYANLNGMNENSCFLWGGKTSIPYKGLPAGRYWQLDNDDHAHHRDPNTGHQSRGRHLLGKFLQFQPATTAREPTRSSAIPRVSSRFCRNGCCSAVSSTKSTWSSSARSA